MSATKQISRSSRLAGLTFGVLAFLPATASAAAPRERELISAQGRGEVRVRPDSLRVEIGAEAQAATLEQARNEVNRRIQGVLDAVNKLQIPGLSLQTQTIDFSPVRNTPTRDEIPAIVGYRAVNSIAVTVLRAAPDDLAGYAARVVDEGTRAGANTVGSIGFFVSDVREAQEQALAEAVRDAKRTARAMAASAGVKLGRLHSIDSSPTYQGRFAERGYAALSAPTPVVTGETAITSSVSIKYHFIGKSRR